MCDRATPLLIQLDADSRRFVPGLHGILALKKKSRERKKVEKVGHFWALEIYSHSSKISAWSIDGEFSKSRSLFTVLCL